ncbi:AMP-binding protein [Sphingosinicella soli]|uniref:Acyl-CoA synthetase (AMP-forming)/AMP-acid ligase II n=1 Tax=Sphingosinicella soli TaxID=333708 RepID=A0A7W7B4C9_9SPHN|nr:AMP-binding protein [Sphingosinicella soli]MBB4632702.1 acyl-CoA synthetase (AMP-forming)/AMP-acid ligase II [Sphingosinicella soli]
MHPHVFAEKTPDKPAIIIAETGETLTYRALEALSNRVAQLIRAHGLKRGDVIALMMENSLEFIPICWGAQRSGIVFTAMSTKLGLSEAQYILSDSGAKMLFASPGLADVAARLEVPGPRFAVGGAIAGFADFGPAVAALPETRISDESQGRDMLYSSGTTGRPKGVTGPLPQGPIDEATPLFMLTKALYGFGETMIYLSPAPLYHAAPLRYSMAVHRSGGTLVVMKTFEPERYLALVAQYRITHTQLVPTMFVRMLKLPDDIRARCDLSSLKVAIHAAAPCPVEVKRRMIDWWGETIHEYYASTEGTGFCAVGPQEWLKKPGTVGRSLLGEIRILDADDQPLPPGREGRIYFAGGGGFSYHNDPEKTKDAQHPDHGATFGDIGYVDEDGYLFLTDRAAYMIITGGVNVYPQEAENVLVMHPKVADVAVFGIPHEEMGEEVKAVVQPRDWADAGPALEAELIAFARAQLSHVKCPRSIDFDPALPRHDTGKLYKRLLKDRYRQAQ